MADSTPHWLQANGRVQRAGEQANSPTMGAGAALIWQVAPQHALLLAEGARMPEAKSSGRGR